MGFESAPGAPSLVDEFPNFKDGNVEITIHRSPLAKIRLHSAALAKSSTWFACQFVEMDNLRASHGGEQAKYHFKLVRNEEESPLKLILAPKQSKGNTIDNDGVRIKTEKGVDTAAATEEMIIQEDSNSVLKQITTLDGYSNFFKAIYSQPLKLSTSDIGTLLNQSEVLVLLANFLGGISSVRIHVTNRLTELRSKLYNAIAANPVRWLNLSVSLRSKAIFGEALIHCAGGFPSSHWPTPLEEIHKDALSIVYRKAEALHAWIKRVELHMLKNTLCDGRNGKPVSPSTGRCAWVVVSLFRDWYLQQTLMLENEEKHCQFAKVFRTINEGGEKYLGSEYVEKQFQALFGARHGLNPKESLEKVKGWAKAVVGPLLKNTLMIEPQAAGIGYLTCVHVGEGDYPWELE